MDEQLGTETNAENPELAAAGPAALEQTSARYVGRWNRLVSTTNWQKGRIICGWRKALIDSGAASGLYSDEAWSQRVGGVSPQHVGRLRRVHERFGQAADQYKGLYWSHFQAALDWDDAEMWLEGAVQNGWSVAAVRQKRWETLGALPDQKPNEADIIAAEPDEDAEAAEEAPPETIGQTPGVVQAPDEPNDEEPDVVPFDEPQLVGDEPGQAPPPFADLPPLPDDLAGPFEELKLAIVRHKLAGWKEISREDVIAALDALKHLALAQQ